MKKNFIKFMALVAVALPMALLSSCGDDDDDIINNNNNNGKDENTEQTIKDEDIKMDGVDFVKKNWLKYDDNGNVTGTAIGKAIYEAEPTVVYVGVEDLKDAIAHFNTAVKPANASMKLVNKNWQAILVDTLGNEQNIIHFDKVDDGTVLAKAYLDKKIGIENYISEIRYIPTSLWPENAGSNSPFLAGCVYTFKGKNYVCLRPFGYGKDGFLVSDINNEAYIASSFQYQSEEYSANYPNANTFKEICKELSSSTVSGSRYWQLLCACAGQTDLKKFKTREYWTCTTNGSSELCVMNLASNSDGKWVEPDWEHSIGFWEWKWWVYCEGTKYWEIYVYRFKVNDKGEVSIWKSNDGIWLHKVIDRTPKASEFVRNEKIEKDSEKIGLQ